MLIAIAHDAIHVLHLGSVPYDTALHLQRTLVQLRKTGHIANTLLLLEHPPVITLGRNAKLDHVLASPEFLAKRGVEVRDRSRRRCHLPRSGAAGRLSHLRPAQLSAEVGAVEFVRRLEEVLIRTCGDFAIGTQRIQWHDRCLDLRSAQQARGQDRSSLAYTSRAPSRRMDLL